MSIYKYKNLLFLRNPFHKSHLEYYEGWQGDSQDSKEFWGFQDVGRDLGAPRGPRVVRVILEGLGGSRGSCESQVTLESKDWVPLFHHALFTQDKPGKESGMRLITRLSFSSSVLNVRTSFLTLFADRQVTCKKSKENGRDL